MDSGANILVQFREKCNKTKRNNERAKKMVAFTGLLTFHSCSPHSLGNPVLY